MSNNKEKFLNLVSDRKTDTIERNKARISKRKMLRESQAIALKTLNRLDELGWTQRKLAEELDVSPQQVNKIVRGKENMQLETLLKLQSVLNIPVLASYYEKKKPEVKLEVKFTSHVYSFYQMLFESQKSVAENKFFSANINFPVKSIKPATPKYIN